MLLSRLTALCFSAALFLASPVGSRAQFEARSTSSVKQYPQSLVIADFNHDGKADVATAAWYQGQIAILLGRGDGTFQPAAYYNIDSEGESVYWVAAGDFNGDGNIDLAVADFLGSDISVLLGNGDGTFQPPVKYPTTETPTFVAVGDFNGDNKLDLIVADAPYVSVLLGNGDGTFHAPTDNGSFPPASFLPIAVGDFDGDGALDAAVIGTGNLELGILLGNGDGTFELAGKYNSGEFSDSVASGDFNGDQKLDLAVADGTANEIYILLGNGDGTFQTSTHFSAESPAVINVADINDDGALDLLFSSTSSTSGQNQLTVMPGNGDGTFGVPANYQTSSILSGIVVGDLNGDHLPDVAVVEEGNALTVLLNTGIASFSPTTPVTFNPQLIGTGSAPQNISLSNIGTRVLSISGLKISGPFQLGNHSTCKATLAPGAKCTLSVVFTPKVIGTTGGLLSISDSASSKPQVVELSGSGTVISLAPTSLNFGTQKVGTKSSPQNVTVTNTGSTTASVTSVTITGANSKDYSQTNTCGKQIGPGGTCTISVTFAPTKTGTRTAVAQINDNGGGGSQGASVTGVGD